MDITPIGVKFSGQKFTNKAFPKDQTRYKRSFHPNWCQTYNWIEYSYSRDAIFCNECRNYAAKKNVARDQTFTHRGYRNWSDACSKNRGLEKHTTSTTHRNAVPDQNESNKRAEMNQNVSALLCETTLQSRRYYVTSIIDIVMLLSSQELAFRGSWDKDAGEEGGLFNVLFKYTLEKMTN